MRMTQKDKPPSESEIREWIGSEACQYWQKMTKWIEQDYPGIFAPEWLYGGQKHGWSLRYKKSRSFCTFIPEKNRFSLLIVFGREERAKVESLKDRLSRQTRKEYDQAKTFADGKWMLLSCDSDRVCQDVQLLLTVKRKPKSGGSLC